jgi:predicted metalloendopeptidase
LAIASAVALSACNTSSSQNAAQQQAQGSVSGIDKSLMDTSVNPGDDFDKYANGKWEASAQIPPDKSSISVFSAIDDEAQKRKAALIDDIVKSNPAPGSDEARIANFYKA